MKFPIRESFKGFSLLPLVPHKPIHSDKHDNIRFVCDERDRWADEGRHLTVIIQPQ
jgi:hypothetical protein